MRQFFPTYSTLGKRLAAGVRHAATAAVNALVAPLDGPPDLSTNPKHIADCGK